MKDILLVDDDELFNFVNTKIIRELGVASEIHTALNGQEAITLINEYLQRSRTLPEVILLDLNMPILDGWEFIDAFRHIRIPGTEDVRIFIVTSSDDPQNVIRARELGVHAYLTKPVSPEELQLAFQHTVLGEMYYNKLN